MYIKQELKKKQPEEISLGKVCREILNIDLVWP